MYKGYHNITGLAYIAGKPPVWNLKNVSSLQKVEIMNTLLVRWEVSGKGIAVFD